MLTDSPIYLKLVSTLGFSLVGLVGNGYKGPKRKETKLHSFTKGISYVKLYF